jgi:prevent-host-death family protein
MPSTPTPGITVDDPICSWLDLAMKTVKIAELKDKLSEHLRAVEHGAEVIVTDRNRPIARILPIAAAEPAIELSPPKVPFASVRKRSFRPAGWVPRSDALLAAERTDR